MRPPDCARCAVAAVAPLALVLVVAVPAAGPPVAAQVRAVYDQGAAGLLQQVERLATTASALHTAAHPDDEDTAFIARVAHGDNGRVAYLSLNRGEGGQNVIGPELSDALGVIRTEELLQARALDGGDQFFTRTYDFGYSKSPEESAQKWDAEEVLADMVRVIRLYRPLVVYSGFRGTAADGHGHHQLAGLLTPLAFEAAADPSRFPAHLGQGLRPWQPKKLYLRQGFRPDPATPATLRLDTGQVDPVLGRSYFEIAMEGRTQHRSQQMGVPELRGRQASALRLVTSVVPVPAEERSVFDGIDTSIPGLAALAGLPEGALTAELGTVDRHVRAALDAFDPRRPDRLLPDLAAGLRGVRAARAALPQAVGSDDARAEADFLLEIKERQFAEALRRAAGLVVDPIADAETVAPGESVGVSLRCFLRDPSLVRVTEVALEPPRGWDVRPATEAEAESASPMARFFRETPDRTDRFVLAVPADAAPTQPYWLEVPRTGDRYVWRDPDLRGVPFAPPLVSARVRAEIAGVDLVFRHPVTYRLVDQVRGELRRNLEVVPRVSIGLDATLEIVPTRSLGRARRVAVRMTSGSRTPVNGAVRLRAPEGWAVTPAEAPVALARKGDRAAVAFELTPPLGTAAGEYRLRAEAVVDGVRYDLSQRVISYEHIQTHRLYEPAEAQVRVLDLAVAPVRVGYVMGSGDRVPDALRRLGLQVSLLDDDQLAAADFSAFDTIVVGIRASEARPAFVANHNRLLSYVRAGGTLVVQYQQSDYAARGLPPYPGEIGSRVTDENAPVALLAPDHPLFRSPNRIGPRDFAGWVQERNLYAFSSFAPEYEALLETTDPGGPPQRGGQLIARVGKGYYVYTAFAWFRQLPAGVPGAYRLMANLVSLPRTMPAVPERKPGQRVP
jgi:LmbE family N-acetylglucosaminyl deacetylase